MMTLRGRSPVLVTVSASLLAAACSGSLPDGEVHASGAASFGMVRAVPSSVPMETIPQPAPPPTAYRFVLPTTTTAVPATTAKPKPKPAPAPVTVHAPPPTAPDQWLTDGLAAVRRCTRSTWSSPGGAYMLSELVWDTYGDGSPSPESASQSAQVSAARKAAMASAKQLGGPWAIWPNCNP